jgi:hypothetical protein
MIYASALSAMLLACIHLVFPRFEEAAHAIKFAWVSFTGGVAIGYVYLYLLPKLGDFTARVAANPDGQWEFLNYRAYLYSLVGFTGYFLAEQFAREGTSSARPRTMTLAGGFFVYNLLIGYTVATIPHADILALIVATAALALHTLGIDHQIRSAGKGSFDSFIRWLLAAALMVGWGAGVLLSVPKELVVLMTAILAGGMIANVMFEEVPRNSVEQRAPFLLGILFFTAVALAMRSVPKDPF